MNMHGPTPAGMGTPTPPSGPGLDRVSFSASLNWASRLTVPAVAACAYLQGKAASKPTRGSIVASLMVLCALLAVLALSAAPAHAEPPRLVPDGSLSTAGFFPDGVGVDNSSGPSQGDIYVASFITPNLAALGHVERFDAAGKLLSPPSPFATGLDGGTAVNPTNGDVYVMSNSPTAIGTYDPNTGALLSSFEVPPSGNGPFGTTAVQIAADSAGDVYVPVTPQNEVLEYDPATCPAAPTPCVPLNTFTGGGVLKGPTGVAVDSSGNLWVADNGNNRIEELSPADVPLGEIHSEGVESAALDGHGDVLAIVKNSADSCGSQTSPCSHLVEYSGGGVKLADVGAGSFEDANVIGATLPLMLAVNEASGRVYVTNGGGEQVAIFAPPTRPVVAKELSAEVATSEAKLGALVSPGGIQTTYRFEYDTREYREGEAPHGQRAPFPEGSVGEGFASRTVWAAASGLAPGTTYHYRVVLTNELGTIMGPDQTFTTQTAAQRSCPNEELRGGFSARLPDCRAYELVTPPTKTSSQPLDVGPVAADGSAIGFHTEEPLLGAPNGSNNYVFTRGAGGWRWEDILPLESYTGVLCSNDNSSQVASSSDELTTMLVAYGRDTRASQGALGGDEGDCNAEGLEVVSGEPVGYLNLLVRDSKTGEYRLVNAPPPGATPADANFKGASADLSHVVFSELAALAPEAPFAAVGGPENLYEWDEGALRLLTMLPGEVPAQGSLAEASNGSRPISEKGSHILFTSGGSLYVRVDGSSTAQVDASQTGGAGGGGSFQAMSADGSTVLFTDENQLTPDSTAAAGEPDLYECVLPEGASKCELSDLTVAKAGEHADVQRVSAFGSQDSSHVYFVAKGVLAEGAEAGQEDLYLWDGATTRFIATLITGHGEGVGAVSPDGAWFAFDSRQSLTGYDNQIGSTTAGEIFLYSAATGQLVCASCNPSGEPAVAGGAELPSPASRPLSDGGRVFFETGEALVPSDTNGQKDVYEHESGQPSLISSGTSSSESTFAGASESGGDAFFESTQQLVPQDTEEGEHVVYDAHVEGGFPAIALPPPCTTADACRVPVAPLPSVFGAPASATFSGAGNVAPPVAVKPAVKPKSKPAKCKRGFVKKKGKCTKKPKRKAKKSAHANKRTGK
jgi:streptogramin lyase